MRGHDPHCLVLVPVLGLCACAAASGLDASTSPEQLAAPASSWVESELMREPMTLLDAAVLSGEASLAAGHFEAALDLLRVASGIDPDRSDLRLAEADAMIGMGEHSSARSLLRDLDVDADEKDRRRVLMRERELAVGFASCDAIVEATPRPLALEDDFIAAWSELRAGLPEALHIPIPADESEAQSILCGDDRYDCDEPRLVRLEARHGASEATIGLILPHEDGRVSVLPDLLHPVWDSCSDDTLLSLERHGDLLRVRAVSDARAVFDPHEWDLGEAAGLGSMANAASSAYYAASSGYGSSGYGSSGYGSSGYGSSGYGSSGYGSSGYASSGCGGYGYGYDYDYDYDYESYSCTPTRAIERDIFIDLSRGEVVLDIVRTGPTSSPLGAVELAEDHVRLAACGVEASLPLSFTSGAASQA